ncbi:hypothetical protein AQUCO_00100105v1 [Aquilegia coerulea]|uniref:Uncharacterized protein n=1 Tax=Aquilegia coerulea TaxID=218851 RepID=A0A2G5F8X2_AQUCA|nr:hypothetical protein AQUCO_00100105v1 [Aquilegia coerulea]
MELSGLKPNAVTMISIFKLVAIGIQLKRDAPVCKGMIRDHGFQPSMEHYSCTMDMLGRAQNLDIEIDMIKSMPAGDNAGASVWGALLSASRNSRNSELGGRAAFLTLEPSNSAGYVLASTICCSYVLASTICCKRNVGGCRMQPE